MRAVLRIILHCLQAEGVAASTRVFVGCATQAEQGGLAAAAAASAGGANGEAEGELPVSYPSGSLAGGAGEAGGEAGSELEAVRHRAEAAELAAAAANRRAATAEAQMDKLKVRCARCACLAALRWAYATLGLVGKPAVALAALLCCMVSWLKCRCGGPLCCRWT